MRKFSLIVISIAIVCFSVFATTYARYAMNINVKTLSFKINAELVTYEVPTSIDSSKLLVRDKFINGLLEDKDYMHTTNNHGDNFKITSDGLYINDTNSTSAFWCYIPFVKSDGYSTSLNINHVYYARCRIKVVAIDTSVDSYFSFGFCNSYHNVSGSAYNFGVSSNTTSKKELTNDEFSLLNVYGKPTKSKERIEDGITLSSDYVDCLQFGTPGQSIISVYIQNIMMFDLTNIYGAGNEPPQSWCNSNIGINTSSTSWI